MPRCKHCNTEISEMLDICPSCGKNPGVETITSVMKKKKSGSASKAKSKKPEKKT